MINDNYINVHTYDDVYNALCYCCAKVSDILKSRIRRQWWTERESARTSPPPPPPLGYGFRWNATPYTTFCAEESAVTIFFSVRIQKKFFKKKKNTKNVLRIIYWVTFNKRIHRIFRVNRYCVYTYILYKRFLWSVESVFFFCFQKRYNTLSPRDLFVETA